MDGSSAAELTGRRRLAGRSGAMLAVAGAALLAIAAITALTTASAKTAARPQHARDFTLAQLGHAGSTVSLTALDGKPVIINFFASWCAPCKRETPLLARYYRAQAGRVLVIGVDSNDESGAALSFMKTEGVGYPVGFDPFPSRATVSYGVLALPQSFFLNSRHIIVRHVVGALTAGELNSWAASLARDGRG